MERIIRSNAVKTSNQMDNGVINAPYLPSESKIASPLANVVVNPKIYGGGLAESGMVSRASARKTTMTPSKWSISLQTVFDQPPSAIPLTVLLSSIAFFTIALTWIWSLRIEEVSQLRLKFLPSKDLAEVFKVTRQAVMMNGIETQPQQNHSYLVDELETQKQQLMGMQTRLNEIKALIGEKFLAQLATNPQLAEVGSMYAVASSKDLILNNTSKNRFAAIWTVDNTIDRFQANHNAMQALRTLLPTSVRYQSMQIEDQQIQKLATEITQLQRKLAETKTRINKTQLNIKQRLLSNIAIIDKPKKSSVSEVFPSKQIISNRESKSFVLMATLPNQQAATIQPGDKIQLKLDTDNQHHENIIFGKALFIIPTNIKNDRSNYPALQIVMKDLSTNVPLHPDIKVNQIATAKIIHHHRVADMFLPGSD